VNKEKQKYEDSYKKWELKSQLYGTELQKQMHEKKLKLSKENFENKENKSFVGSFHNGGKTPEKITAYNRPNKILQSKLRNYSEIMKDKENCAKRAITPKPRVAAVLGVLVSKAQPKKIDIGKNLVAKDLYNELRFQITGKN
jgi:major membrane immunogen (membrane-anchored lipoprotein)